jgi:hypothetical protein
VRRWQRFAFPEKRLEKAPLIEHLHSAALQGVRPRFLGPRPEPVEHDDINTRQPQLAGERHPGRSGSGDHYFSGHLQWSPQAPRLH